MYEAIIFEKDSSAYEGKNVENILAPTKAQMLLFFAMI